MRGERRWSSWHGGRIRRGRRPGASLLGLGVLFIGFGGGVGSSLDPGPDPPEPGTVTDFDGNAYVTVKIGDQWWMAENLRSLHDVQGEVVESRIYTDDASLESTFGRLYSWHAVMAGSPEAGAQGICPQGWHIPTEAEWDELFIFAGGDSIAGGALKATGTAQWQGPNAGATDAFGFHGVPGGGLNGENFEGMGVGGHYWSSSGSGSEAFAPTLHRDTPEIVRLTLPKTFALSVRCVR